MPAQAVDATLACILVAGVWKPNVFLDNFRLADDSSRIAAHIERVARDVSIDVTRNIAIGVCAVIAPRSREVVSIGGEGNSLTKNPKPIQTPLASHRKAGCFNLYVSTWGATRTLESVAELLNPAVRGWVAYYGRFYRSKCLDILCHYLTETLVRWAMRKYKRFRGRWGGAYHWLGCIAARDNHLFFHWSLDLRPTVKR